MVYMSTCSSRYISRYTLMCITYGNGGHFCSSLNVNKKWYLYDGLKHYNIPGSGLTYQTKPAPLERYFRNYCVFVKNEI